MYNIYNTQCTSVKIASSHAQPAHLTHTHARTHARTHTHTHTHTHARTHAHTHRHTDAHTHFKNKMSEKSPAIGVNKENMDLELITTN